MLISNQLEQLKLILLLFFNCLTNLFNTILKTIQSNPTCLQILLSALINFNHINNLYKFQVSSVQENNFKTKQIV